MMPDTEMPILKSAKREALATLLIWFVTMIYIWFVTMIYSVGCCCVYGYGRDPESLTFVFGFPDGFFWRHRPSGAVDTGLHLVRILLHAG